MTVNSTAVTNSTTISLNVSVSAAATAGVCAFNVINGDGGPVTKSGALTVDARTDDQHVSPVGLGQGATSQTVTVTGTGFVSGSLLAAAFTGGSA